MKPGVGFQHWPLWRKAWGLTHRPLRRARRQFRDLPPGDYRSVMDIGAYDGEFTEAAALYYGAERFWLVEANPVKARALEARFAGRPGHRVIHAAVASEPGTLRFSVNQHAASSSLLTMSSRSGALFGREFQVTEQVTVPALSLDALFAQERIEGIDLMKIDIQGAERMLIEGGQQALPRVRTVYIEVLFEEQYEGAALFGEIDQRMKRLGFQLYTLSGLRRGATGGLVYGDAVYRRPG
jgi:FkbM family methyltransferase